MMLVPATDALKRCKESDRPTIIADIESFGMNAVYDQAMVLDIPFAPPFPVIAWPESSSDSECQLGTTDLVKTETKKRVLRKHTRKSKHRMVRSKSQYKGLCGLDGSLTFSSNQ